MVAYLDQTGQRVALMHIDLRPDGMLDVSGRPDSQELIDGGVT